MSFIECTAMSIRPSLRASSISLVNRPLPPMAESGPCNIRSPVVWMISTARAPFARSAGSAAARRRPTSSAWARASGLARVPILIRALIADPGQSLVKWDHRRIDVKRDQ